MLPPEEILQFQEELRLSANAAWKKKKKVRAGITQDFHCINEL